MIPDRHPANVSAARTFALKNADAILLAGARLNWVPHFGLPPRFRPDFRFAQIDIATEEFGANVPAAVGIAADLKKGARQFAALLEARPWQGHPDGPWRKGLAKRVAARKAERAPALGAEEVLIGYYRPLQEIREVLPDGAIVVTEGANTMVISRSVLEAQLPRHRLGPGSWGTIGVSSGFALAAAVVHPDKPVVALVGGSAFDFSGMEVEVAVRHKLPITCIVFNNNGIGGVADPSPEGPPPVNVLLPGARYDKFMAAFGKRGVNCSKQGQLGRALKKALASGDTGLIHVPIAPDARRVPQSHYWLSR